MSKLRGKQGKIMKNRTSNYENENLDDMNDFNRNWRFIGELNGVNTFLFKDAPLPLNPISQVEINNEGISRFIWRMESSMEFFTGKLSGYSSVCGSHYVESGTYFYEVNILKANDIGSMSQVRIGFADHQYNKNTPCGSGVNSYSWNSKKGDKFHNGMVRGGEKYGDSYKTGCLIHLPKKKTKMRVRQERTNDISDDGKKLVFVRNFFLPEIVEGSFISFYKNGKDQGRAFTRLKRSRYYPTVSLFRGARVEINFGPNFSFFPTEIRPLSAYSSANVREELIDGQKLRDKQVREKYPFICDHTKDLESHGSKERKILSTEIRHHSFRIKARKKNRRNFL